MIRGLAAQLHSCAQLDLKFYAIIQAGKLTVTKNRIKAQDKHSLALGSLPFDFLFTQVYGDSSFDSA